MTSSTSSSERRWRGFALALTAAAVLPATVIYLFVVLVDPWGMLPLHLPVARVPISTNARFSFPALATDPSFDAAIIGTSTSRLLRPAALNAPFDAHFVNLAMNAATAWEQGRMLVLFARTHPKARAVIVGLDQSWCLAGPDSPRLTGRPFPRWMYGGTRWNGYWHMFDLYAVQEAANQFAVMIGIKRPRYGLDGYTNFLPPDGAYDPARVAAEFKRWGPVSDAPAGSGPVLLPYVDGLSGLLSRLPPSARKVLFFPPVTVGIMGRPGSAIRASWDACKRAAASVARTVPNTAVADFALDDAVDRSHDNFWDPLHYRIGIANDVMRSLATYAEPLPGKGSAGGAP